MHNILVSLTLKVISAALASKWLLQRLSLTLIVGSCAAILPGCYAFKQVYYQGNLLSTRKPISLLIWERSTPPELKKALMRVEDIRAFARREGLAVGGAYSTYIESPHDAVSYVVQASDPLRLKLRKWWFPIIGEMPYLGFFHEKNRDEKAAELRTLGYDVALSEAGAFSSLGWYDDPIYSSMLNRSLSSLAHLLFHELTHRTFWIPNEADLNEHMAEFVATTLTRAYLKGKNKKGQLDDYVKWLDDKRLYGHWLKKMRKDLQTLYNETELSDNAKLAAKAEIFARYMDEDFPKFATNRYNYLRKMEWNNAVVLATSMYVPMLGPFENAYKCGNFTSVGNFLTALKGKITEDNRPARKVLESFCSPSTVAS